MTLRRCMITGLGAITPAGIGWKENWKSLLDGRSGVRTISAFSTTGYRTTIAADIPHFSPAAFMQEKLADGTDRFTQLAIGATRLALEDSRLSLKADDLRTGIVVGCGMGGLPFFEKQSEIFAKKGPSFMRPSSVPRIMPNAAGAHISALWKLRGPNITISTACSSSNHAVGYALDLIRTGRCDRVICGGTESLLSPMTFAAFDALRVMSRHNAAPKRACRPFDKNRDGFVMGEGAVMFVVEELMGARARGASIYAEVAGYGSSNGGYNILAPEPDGQEAAQSMDTALADAGITPAEVSYVHAHGTATRSNDLTETRAIKKSFGFHAKKLLISSTKAVTGHMMGAAGAMGILVSALAIKTSRIPMTLNLETADLECDLDYVPRRSAKAAVRVALSNAFAFGSNNATIILKKEEK